MVKSYKILYIEDDLDFQAFMEELMNNLDYLDSNVELSFRDDGSSGLNAVKEQDFDIIYVDYKLPDEDGLNILKKIREIDKRLPVVIVTAHGDQDVVIKALGSRAASYIRKTGLTADRIKESIKDAEEWAKQRMPVSKKDRHQKTNRKELNLLNKLIEEDLTSIDPKINLQTEEKYRYPKAEKILDQPREETINILTSLVDRNLLEKDFHDQILAPPEGKCSECGSNIIRFK